MNALIQCSICVTHGYVLINHINTSNFGDTFILSTEHRAITDKVAGVGVVSGDGGKEAQVS